MRRETLLRSTRGARALSLALALGLTAACKEVKPAAPNIAAVEPPDPPLSMIQAPITVPVAALRNVADQQVPRQLHTDPYLHLIDGGPDVPHCSLGVGYDISRDPLTMSGSGATLRTGLHVRYWLDARKRLPCPGPLVSGSCGTNGEAAREVNAGFNTRLGIGADWNAIVSTSADAPVPLNSCNVSFLGIDVTDKVMSFFGNKLNEMANRLNQQATTDLKLRDRALAAWQQLQQPIKLADDTWLSVAPQDIGYFPINASSTAISLGLQLTARPRVVLSAAQPTTPPRELPAARSLPAGRAFNISLPIDIGYEPINRQLRTLLSLDSGGTTFPPAGSRKVTITGAEVYAYGRQAVVRLTFKGDAKGWAYLVGTPAFDAVNQVISFPDLDYSVETRNILLRLANWLGHDELRDYLRGRLRFEVRTATTRAREQLLAGMNRTIGGIRIAGTIENLTPLGLTADPQRGQFRAFVNAAGTLDLALQ